MIRRNFLVFFILSNSHIKDGVVWFFLPREDMVLLFADHGSQGNETFLGVDGLQDLVSVCVCQIVPHFIIGDLTCGSHNFSLINLSISQCPKQLLLILVLE